MTSFSGELRADVLAGHERKLAHAVPKEHADLFHTGEPNDAQLDLINRLSLRDLRANELFVWPIQAVNNLTFAYSMWMDESSLTNFAEDANGPRGIPYLRNHRSDEDPHGRVFAGVLVEDGKIGAPQSQEGSVPHARDLFRRRKGDSVLRLYEMVFMPRGLTINGAPNDDLVRNLEAGVQASNSIGFHTYGPLEPGSFIECDICGCDMFRADLDRCHHFPGLEYEEALSADEDAPKSVVLSTARVVGARQSEVSGVYLGAVPETYTERAGTLFRAGHMSQKDARRLEEQLSLGRGRIVGDVRTYHQTGAIVAPRTTEPTQPPSGGHDEGAKDMKDLLARVKELVAGDNALWADLELHGVEDDPARALVEHHKAEVARLRDELSDANDTHTAFKSKLAERLGQTEDETMDHALARIESERKVAGEVRERLLVEYLRQLTRAGMPGDEAEERTLVASWTLAQVEKKTAQLKKRADSQVTTGMLHEPEIASRNDEDDAPSDAAPLKPTMRPVAARY